MLVFGSPFETSGLLNRARRLAPALSLALEDLHMYIDNVQAADGTVYMPSRVDGLYLCMPCDVQFSYDENHTNCPSCSTNGREDLAALYVEHDAVEAEFVQANHFTGGD